jgi:hypothetical protein
MEELYTGPGPRVVSEGVKRQSRSKEGERGRGGTALNTVDPLHNCMFENKLCLQNVFAKIILQCSGRLRKLEI